MIYQTWKLGSSLGSISNVLMQARLALMDSIQNGENSEVHLIAFSTLTASFASLLFATGRKDRQFWIVTVVAFLICILGTGRASLLNLTSGLCAILLLQSKKEFLRGAIRLIRWPLALFVALCIVLIFANKNTEEMTGGVTSIAIFSVVSYIVGPSAAFDRVVQSPAEFMSTGNYTFYFFLHWAAKMHLIDYTTPPVVDPFVFVPFMTNVYTGFEHYYLELGLTGTLAILSFFGLLHSLLYLKARQGGSFSIYLFAYSIYSVLMVTFVDTYNEIPAYTLAIVFGLLYFFIGSVSFRLFQASKQGHVFSQSGR
jgi:oligosaccharide repeat unit polymerase